MFFIVCLLPLEIQLWRWECWDPINWLNPTIFLCLSLFKLSFCDIVEEEYLLSELMCIIVLAYSNKGFFETHLSWVTWDQFGGVMVCVLASSAVDRGFKPKNFYDINNYITSVFHWNVTIWLVMKWSHDYKRDVSHPNETQIWTCTCLHDDVRCKQSMA